VIRDAVVLCILSHSCQNHQWVVTLLMKQWALMKARLVKALV